MLQRSLWRAAILILILMGTIASARGDDYPAPKDGDWVTRDFHFQSGEVLPDLRLHYTTVGNPNGAPVLVLHGTNGSGAGMLNMNFGAELFGPGQPLDASRYFIILPDAIGAGKSSKPSDGLRAKFPHYTYDDMIRAEYLLLTEHLGIGHLRLVVGESQGGMKTWRWAELYPNFMDVAVPLASLPTAMSGRNWMMRRMLIDAIRNDPDYNGGNYTQQPRGFHAAQVYFGLATNGGTRALYKAAPTRARADQLISQRLAQASNADANDVLYQQDASRDYDPGPQLEKIQAYVLAINSQDDERNPAELGILEREIKRVKHGQYVLIPTSDETHGHGTAGSARLWKQHLADLLKSIPAK